MQRERFLAACEPVTLEFAAILAEPGEHMHHVYFPTKSFISLVAQNNGRPSLEVAMIGNEGMLGISLMLGIDVSPLHALVQGAGSALRMDVEVFRRELEQNPALERILQRYLYVEMSQFAQTAGSTPCSLVADDSRPCSFQCVSCYPRISRLYAGRTPRGHYHRCNVVASSTFDQL